MKACPFLANFLWIQTVLRDWIVFTEEVELMMLNRTGGVFSAAYVIYEK